MASIPINENKIRPFPARIVPLITVLATATAFLPALENGFVDWDDTVNFINNPYYRGLGLKQLRWMFGTALAGHFQPLTWVTHGADYLLWGLNPLGYHLGNLALHALNAWFFYLLSLRLLALSAPAASSRSWDEFRLSAGFAALFFSIHPLRVESVAWATERRDVVSGFFYLLTILWYLKAQEANTPGGARWRIAALGAYVLSLLSKAIGMTLPIVLVVLDVYPLGRLPGDPRRWLSPEYRRIWREKIPFMALAPAFAVMAYIAQWNIEALVSLEKFGFAARMMQSLFGMAFYLLKTLVPWHLSPLYEAPSPFDPLAWPFVLSASAVAAFSASLVALRRRFPAGLAAGIFYAATLSPVSGLVRVGPHIAADRYTYISCLGWAVIFGAAIRWVLGRLSGWRRGLAMAGSGIILAALGCMTWEQTKIWRDTETLWRHALSIDPGNAVASNNLGVAAADKGRLEDSVRLCRRAVSTRPDFALAHENLAGALVRLGRLEEAASHYRQALKLNPDSAKAHNYLGSVLARQGRLKEAERHYRAALRLRPDYAEAHYNLGVGLGRQGRLDQSVSAYREALKADPHYAQAQNNLGLALAGLGRLDEAAACFREAIRSQPRDAQGHYNLGNALAKARRLEDAIRRYREALRLSPGLLDARFNLANTLAGQGRLRQATEQYRLILKERPGYTEARENLGKVLRLAP